MGLIARGSLEDSLESSGHPLLPCRLQVGSVQSLEDVLYMVVIGWDWRSGEFFLSNPICSSTLQVECC